MGHSIDSLVTAVTTSHFQQLDLVDLGPHVLMHLAYRCWSPKTLIPTKESLYFNCELSL